MYSCRRAFISAVSASRSSVGKVRPGLQHLHLVAGGRERVSTGTTLAAQPREARQRRHGGGRHAVEGHEDRFLGAEVHVGQQVQRLAFAQRRHDFALDAVARPNGRTLPKRWRPAQHPARPPPCWTVGVDADEGPRHLQRQRGPRRIQADEVRRKNHGRLVAGEFLQRARQHARAAAHQVGRVPEPGAVQPGLREVHEGLRVQRAPLRRVQPESTGAGWTSTTRRRGPPPHTAPSRAARPGRVSTRSGSSARLHEEDAAAADPAGHLRSLQSGARCLVARIAPEVLAGLSRTRRSICG
jgi:hypothetical protein